MLELFVPCVTCFVITEVEHEFQDVARFFMLKDVQGDDGGTWGSFC